MKQYATIEECIDLKDEIITLYFKDIAKYRPLNAVEEAQLAEKIKEGDKAAIHKLVKSNLRFVVSVARKYQAQGVELIDLINIGNIGLIKRKTLNLYPMPYGGYAKLYSRRLPINHGFLEYL